MATEKGMLELSEVYGDARSSIRSSVLNVLQTQSVVKAPVTDKKSLFPKCSFWKRYTNEFCIRALHVYITLSGQAVVALGNEDGSCSLWDLDSGKCFHKLTGAHSLRLRVVVVCDTHVATGADDKNLGIWSLQTGELLHFITGAYHWMISGMAFYSLGYNAPLLLACCSFDKVSTIWNVASGKAVKQFTGGHINGAYSVTVFDGTHCNFANPEYNCHWLVTGGFDKTIVLWNVQTAEIIRKFENGHLDFITDVCVYYNHHEAEMGRRVPLIVTCSYDMTAIVWDVMCGNIVHKLVGHTDWILSVDIHIPSHPKGRPTIVTAGHDGLVITWEIATGLRMRTYEGVHKGAVSGAKFLNNKHAVQNATKSTSHADHPFGNDIGGMEGYLLTAGEDGQLVLWNSDSQYHRPYRGHKGVVVSLAVFTVPLHLASPFAGQTLIASGGDDGLVLIWDLFSGEIVKRLTGGHTMVIFHIAVYIPREGTTSGCENLLIASAGQDNFCLWDFNTETILFKLGDLNKNFISIMKIVNPSEAMVASAAADGKSSQSCVPMMLTGRFDGTASAISIKTGKVLGTMKGHIDYVGGIALCENKDWQSSWFVTAAQWVCLWDVTNYTMVHKFEDKRIDRMKSMIVYDSPEHGPVMITGNLDKTGSIWDLHSGKIVKRLEGAHSNWVTTVAAGQSGVDGCEVILTGGFEGKVFMWDLHSGKLIRNLEINHTDAVRCVQFVPRKDGTPLVVSGSNDGLVLVTDTLHPLNCMPPKSGITRAFELDEAGSIMSFGRRPNLKNWPRITAMHRKFGEPLWCESPELFILAAVKRRSDFFLLFKDQLTVVLNAVAALTVTPDVSLLRYVIVNKDLETLRPLLECWSINLRLPLRESRGVVHASCLLPKDELILLAREYPTEFSKFICSLKLVTIENHQKISAHIDNDTRTVVVGSYDAAADDDLCRRIRAHKHVKAHDKDHNSQPVTLMYLPVQDATHIDMLKTYMEVCLSNDSVDLFDSEVGIIALRYAWDKFGEKTHWTAVARYVFFLVLFTISCLTFARMQNGTKALQALAWTFMLIMIVGALHRIRLEYWKIRTIHNNDLIHFFSDIWNISDTVSLSCMLTGCFIRMGSMGETNYSRCFLAVAAVSLWFKSLYFLRPLPASGPLVSMIIKIAFDIRYFLMVLFCVLVGFAQAFWLLSYPNVNLPFGTITNALLNSYLYMLGNAESDFEGTASPSLSTLLLVLFLFFMAILMLNLLIALMGQSFASVSDKGLAQWRLEQASIILDQMFTVTSDKLILEPYVYVLRYNADLDKSIENISLEEHMDAKFLAMGKRIETITTMLEAINKETEEAVEVEEKVLTTLETSQDSRLLALEDKMTQLDTKLDLILKKLK